MFCYSMFIKLSKDVLSYILNVRCNQWVLTVGGIVHMHVAVQVVCCYYMLTSCMEYLWNVNTFV